jgi:biopolymer transport protein ExbD
MKLRRSLSSDHDEPTELNLIPLIDVIMFLLIFFISTTSFMEEPGMKVDKPAAGGAAQGESKSIILAIKTDGRILHDGRDIGLNGVRPTVKRLCVQESLPVVIVTDENARSSSLIKVIDEAKMGGAKDVSLAAEKG